MDIKLGVPTTGNHPESKCLCGLPGYFRDDSLENEGPVDYALDFEVAKPANVIEIEVPVPIRPIEEGRTIGVGLIKVMSAGPIKMSAGEARSVFGSSLEDGIDFSRTELPPFVAAAIGLCEAEPWGRWSLGGVVQIDFKHKLQGDFVLHLDAVGYGANSAQPVGVEIGQVRKMIRLPATFGEQGVCIIFSLSNPSSRIIIHVPHPTIPPSDNRRIGVGLAKLKIVPILTK